MKNQILRILALALLVFLFSAKSKDVITTEGYKHYKIRKTKMDQIIRDFGNDFEKENDRQWWDQLHYKHLGLSFSFDNQNFLRAIEFYHPFKGSTDRKIELGVSTMLDVQRAYDSLDWYISPPMEEWCSEHNGIEFCVKRDTSLSIWPLNEEIHAHKKNRTNHCE